MRRLGLVIALLPLPALAADEIPHRIVVAGTATVQTPPDRAEIDFVVHGEGTTNDEAVAAMAAKRKAIDAGLGRYAQGAEVGVSNVQVQEVRGRDCNRQGYGQPKLSTGDCAIIGYAADMQVSMRTGAVNDAGTIVGLVGRLGATNPRVSRYFLTDDHEAQRRATIAAIADAKQQAEALAQGSGVKIGEVIALFNTDQNARQDIVVTGNRIVASAPPPPPPPPPVAVDAKPRPIETRARVSITYGIVY